MRQLRERASSYLSSDIGIDLGTTNTLIYFKGKGIVINESTVVAVNQKTGRVVAVGAEAKQMLGRTPEHITAVKPLVDGVISDFEVTEEMIAYFLSKAQEGGNKIFGPRVVIGVPSGTTNVERRAVRDATRNAGAREVHVITEPIAAALGIRLPINKPMGSMIVDIGGGTTDVAILSLDGVVTSRNVKIAGERLNRDIASYIRDEFKILVGEKTAEDVKIAIGSVVRLPEANEQTVRGRDLVTGLPREVIITDSDVREAISGSVDSIAESIKETIESTPPEIVADVMKQGVFLVGGGALLRGIDDLLSEWLKVPVYVADEPLTAVARGTGVVLENFPQYSDMLVAEEHELPPTT